MSKHGVWLQRESGVDLSDIYVWRMTHCFMHFTLTGRVPGPPTLRTGGGGVKRTSGNTLSTWSTSGTSFIRAFNNNSVTCSAEKTLVCVIIARGRRTPAYHVERPARCFPTNCEYYKLHSMRYSGTWGGIKVYHCHLHPLQAAKCCRNSRLVVDEDDLNNIVIIKTVLGKLSF